MGLFSKSKKPKFNITENDRNWVEENFKWIVSVLGSPHLTTQYVIDSSFFPKTFAEKPTNAENIVGDLCNLLGLDARKISIEISNDIRDTYGIVYEMESNIDIVTEVFGGKYALHIAKSITVSQKILLIKLILELVKIRLIESQVNFDSGEETEYFIYLAAIYFGFGPILLENHRIHLTMNDGYWESKSNYVSPVHSVVMSYAMAVYQTLTEFDDAEWKKSMSKETLDQLKAAEDYLIENPSHIFEEGELLAYQFANEAFEESLKNNFQKAILILEKSLKLEQPETLLANTYNNLGYNLMRLGEFKESIEYFEKAIKYDPKFGFAYDNLGYALIKIGKLEEGELQLRNAIHSKTNDEGYSFLNYALYHQAKKETKEAQRNFDLAFKSEGLEVDLLEYYYAEFLMSQGKVEQGLEFLKKAVAKNEPEAIARLKEFSTN